jgi:hypothetical protein
MKFATLEEILRWGEAELVEVITQDEYTHDVVMAWNGRYLVYDTT